jgi:hypothetical protein
MESATQVSRAAPHPWLRVAIGLWIAAVVSRLVFAWFTLAHTPAIYPDEVMVADYGRNILEYPADSSVVWSFATDSPRVPLYSLGCVAMEWACRASGESPVGARMLGVVASLVAATFLLLWMRASGVGWRIGLVGTSAFMLDPLLVAVSRSGRPDTLVMAFALASCWLLRVAGTRMKAGEGARWRFAAAGFLAGVTPFLWPSAVFLLLLVAAELLRLVTAGKGTWRDAFCAAIKPWTLFCAGGAVAAILLFLPLWRMWPEALKQFLWLTEIASTTGTLGDWWLFLHSFRVSPLLLAAVAVSAAVMWRRDRLLVLAVGSTTLFLVQSLIYHFRAGYALPSYYALVISACAVLAVPSAHMAKRFAWAMLAVLLAWNMAFSLGFRGWIAYDRAQAQSDARLRSAAEAYVGKGNYRVLDANMVFYYVGRQLGWQMFRPEVAHNYGMSKWNDALFTEFLRRVDVAIIPQPGQIWNVEKFSRDEGAALEKAGFAKTASFDVSAPAGSQRPWWDRVLLGGGPDYGTFDVYARPGVLSAR